MPQDTGADMLMRLRSSIALTLVTLTSLDFLRVVGLLLLYCLSVSAAQADTVSSLHGVRPYFYDGMLKRRVIRVLVPPSKTMFFLDKGEAYGITVEALREFGSTNGMPRSRSISKSCSSRRTAINCLRN